jgi:hypothetical protein
MVPRFLSLGWGLQSSTIAVMAALGDIEPIQAAIHSPTPEREATLQYAETMTGWLFDRGVIVLNASPVDHMLSKVVDIPAFTGSRGQLKRQCTQEWKIRPLRRVIRQWIKGTRPMKAAILLGISTDEWSRAKTSDVQYLTHEFPLLDMGMSRKDCQAYLESKGLPVPVKSSCVFCPYQSKSAWRDIGQNPTDRAIAIAYDESIRHKVKGNPAFVHPDKIPLADILKAPGEPGYQYDMLDHIDENAPCKSGYCWA